MNRKIIAIVGPTASGKTGIGVKLAKELGGEIISADSRQVYKGLDLGTGKDLAEYDGVKYHLIDICEPGERFTLFDYLPLARSAIKDIFSRGKIPIIVGGTGLYVQALTEGFQLEPITNHQLPISNKISNSKSPEAVIPDLVGDPLIVDSRLRGNDKFGRGNDKEESGNDKEESGNDNYTRERLENLTTEQLQKIMKKLDIETYKKIDINNPHRLIRAIERAQEGNTPSKNKPDFDVLQIGMSWPKEVLDARIDKRVEERFEQGMLKEIEDLLKNGVDPDWLMGLGLEYREITNYVVNKNTSFEEMKDELRLRSHQYAKRQMTWFKRFPEIVWENDYFKISKTAKKFLKDC